MPSLILHLSDEEIALAEEIALWFGKEQQPSIEMSGARWLYRILRTAAQLGNAQWYDAEREKKIIYFKPDKIGKPTDEEMPASFKDLNLLRHEKQKEDEKGIRLVFIDGIMRGLERQAAIDTLYNKLVDRPSKWTDFNEWVHNKVSEQIAQSRVWAEGKAFEQAEKDAFAAKPKKKKD